MTRFYKALSCAASGVAWACKSERHMRIHLLATVFVIGTGWYQQVSQLSWCLLLLCCGGVIAAELFNTALEAVVNLVSPEYHFLAKRAKDCAAGAVLVLSATSVIIALVIFL